MKETTDEGFVWQVGVWDRMSEVYQREIDSRFRPVIEKLLEHADLNPGERILDLGTGTGSVAIEAAAILGPEGQIIAVDISPDMLDKARARTATLSLATVEFAEGRAEEIPAEDGSVDSILASLSMMYVIDRERAAREIARVLRPGGRFVAAVWAGPDDADIVHFQQIAGTFAPAPPVEGVGPGALADPGPFLSQLSAAGLDPSCERTTTGFHFDHFDDAWETLAGVTTASLEPSIQEQAKAAVQQRMWPDAHSPRAFENTTQYIVARKPA